eukprot:TRINITY_DN12834_c0_g1_i1.p1 TRINITY_DN12834_c0_g1~~TRINITY_DN12834_c0_g1_i1.p1  ORF type:complete len:391 (-),score=109.66 TRINITY_DN12834_c0_g1_i1:368-1540(-)
MSASAAAGSRPRRVASFGAGRLRATATLAAALILWRCPRSGGPAGADGEAWVPGRTLLEAAHRGDVLEDRSALVRDALAFRERRLRDRRTPRAADEMIETTVTASAVQQELLGQIFRLTSNVHGFPDFRSLVELRADGTVMFSAGMVSKEPGQWSCEPGDPENGESREDVYLSMTQPLTDRYKTAFTITGDQCFWRGRVDIRRLGKKGSKKTKVVVDDGIVISELPSGVLGNKKFVREGSFIALLVDEKEAEEVRLKAKEAFERALLAPRGENTGFKTPARIAGVERGQRLALKVRQEKRAALRAAAEDEKKKQIEKAEDLSTIRKLYGGTARDEEAKEELEKSLLDGEAPDKARKLADDDDILLDPDADSTGSATGGDAKKPKDDKTDK